MRHQIGAVRDSLMAVGNKESGSWIVFKSIPKATCKIQKQVVWVESRASRAEVLLLLGYRA